MLYIYVISRGLQQVEAPSAASIVANGISGKIVGSDAKVEPKSVPEEVDGGKHEDDGGGNTAVEGEEKEKSLMEGDVDEKVMNLSIIYWSIIPR